MKIRAVAFEFIANRQTDRRGGGFCFIICIDIPTNLHKTITNYIPKISGRITLSISENRMKIREVVFEFFVSRQTDRRGGGLCFIICIDNGLWE